MSEVPVITVDGPSGTGKGTICSLLAIELNWHLLDSGALYRVVAFAAEQQGQATNNGAILAKLAQNLDLKFENRAGSDEISVILDGNDVSQLIRSESCGNAASRIAAVAEVREALLHRQRAFRQAPGLIADGRDMGTIVFPDAGLKVFLTASSQERAKRRYKQLIEKGINVNLRDLSADIAERDKRDEERSVSPLIPAEDAIVIDTTECDIETVNRQILTLVKHKFTDLAVFV